MGRADKKFKIITEVVKLLRESEELAAMVGPKIFPIVAPEGTVGDFVSYQRDGLDIESSKMGTALQRSYFYINVVSDDYDRSLDIADTIYDTLEGDFVNPDMRIRLTDYTEDYVDKKFLQVLQFSIQ
jgi:hypothetical protein